MRISIDLSEEQGAVLKQAASRLGLKPEDLARAGLSDMLGFFQEDFQQAAGYVLEKNRELYRRLS